MTPLFAIAAALALAGAVGVIVSRNPVHGVISLIGSFLALSALYLSLEAEFLAMVQVIVYAGAVMILFLFVIAFLTSGKGALERDQGHLRYQGLLSVVVAVGTGLLLLAAVAGSPGLTGTPAALPPGFGGVRHFGQALLTVHLLPFEIAAFVLMVAVVGVVLLAGRR
ncbi:MAG: NADH-quinone oxidoreductase subunit J [Clostridia bacterium]|nr:NADH-quinone oxidoreductase subunit J [Clostridia bacterium]